MNFFGELSWFCSRESLPVLTGVCARMSQYWQAMGTSSRPIWTGEEVDVATAGGGGVGQRDDEEEGEEMGSFPWRTHRSANQPWAPPRTGAVDGATWGVAQSLKSHQCLLRRRQHTGPIWLYARRHILMWDAGRIWKGGSNQPSVNVCGLCTCYLEM